MKVSDRTREILSKVSIYTEPQYLVCLPPITLSRSEYEGIDKVFTQLGGKWNRKLKGHVFDHDPTNDISVVIATGTVTDMKQLYQFFPTPRAVAQQMCDIADIDAHSIVLEPSCGNGALADVIWEYQPQYLLGIELNTAMETSLRGKPYDVLVGQDFLQMSLTKYPICGIIRQWNRIIMNPPFSHHQDIDHVMHAYGLLEQGGILVAIMSASGFFCKDKKSVAFREFLQTTCAIQIAIAPGSFKESGTMVPTYMVRIQKSIS